MFEGADRETVVQQPIFIWHGSERVLKFASELVKQRARQFIVATKSNGIAIVAG